MSVYKRTECKTIFKTEEDNKAQTMQTEAKNCTNKIKKKQTLQFGCELSSDHNMDKLKPSLQLQKAAYLMKAIIPIKLNKGPNKTNTRPNHKDAAHVFLSTMLKKKKEAKEGN